MAASIKITFSPKSGDKKEFSYPAGTEDHPDLKTMISSLRKLQENANNLLTEIVEKDRKGQNSGNQMEMPESKCPVDAEEEMDDEEESDEDEPVQEPNPKKAKT